MYEESPFFQMSAEDYLELPRTKALLAAANTNLKGKGSKSIGDIRVGTEQGMFGKIRFENEVPVSIPFTSSQGGT